MEITFKQCTQADAGTLRALSCKTLQETFAASNPPSQLQAYLDSAYAEEKLRAELGNESSQFYFLYCDGGLAGYLKLNTGPAQTEFHDQAALEVERIYLSRSTRVWGLGGYLIERAIALAAALRKQYVWLGVWEKNQRAISFYEKHGFRRAGAHSFFVGDDEQTDYIMRRDL